MGGTVDGEHIDFNKNLASTAGHDDRKVICKPSGTANWGEQAPSAYGKATAKDDGTIVFTFIKKTLHINLSGMSIVAADEDQLGVIKEKFTICTLARARTRGASKRIFTGDSKECGACDFFHGYERQKRGRERERERERERCRDNVYDLHL